MDGQQHDRFTRLLAVTRTRRGPCGLQAGAGPRMASHAVGLFDSGRRFSAPSLAYGTSGGLTSGSDKPCGSEVAHGRIQIRRAGTLPDA